MPGKYCFKLSIELLAPFVLLQESITLKTLTHTHIILFFIVYFEKLCAIKCCWETIKHLKVQIKDAKLNKMITDGFQNTEICEITKKHYMNLLFSFN